MFSKVVSYELGFNTIELCCQPSSEMLFSLEYVLTVKAELKSGSKESLFSIRRIFLVRESKSF